MIVGWQHTHRPIRNLVRKSLLSHNVHISICICTYTNKTFRSENKRFIDWMGGKPPVSFLSSWHVCFHEDNVLRHWSTINATDLTHWGRVTHICVSDVTNIGSDNGLSPGRRQAIIRTNAGILLITPLGTDFSEMLIEIHIFPFTKIHLKMSSGKWRPFCLGLNELIHQSLVRQSLLAQHCGRQFACRRDPCPFVCVSKQGHRCFE